MEYVLETNGLSKRYRDFTALNGLNMHIPKGSIYGFVGRNGAGKTTLIRLICGLQEPTSGSFTLYGVKNTDAKIERARRRMGAVVESPAVYPDMTAEENLRQQYRFQLIRRLNRRMRQKCRLMRTIQQMQITLPMMRCGKRSLRKVCWKTMASRRIIMKIWVTAFIRSM